MKIFLWEFFENFSYSNYQLFLKIYKKLTKQKNAELVFFYKIKYRKATIRWQFLNYNISIET